VKARPVPILGIVLAAAGGSILLGPPLVKLAERSMRRSRLEEAIAGRLAEHGEAARARLLPCFERAGVPYPPARVVLLGLKRERLLEVYAAGPGGPLRRVMRCPVLGASGGPGPKLREGDGQVPEGLYHIESLNPWSRHHLSLRVSDPNQFDREQARREGRRDLGGDIMIHGGSASAGCLAVGDPAAEDLFVLAAETGLERLEVVLSPLDFRRGGPGAEELRGVPPWTPALYEAVRAELAKLPAE
jgi:hypothetical protein